MELSFLKEFIDYGGMFVIAIGMFWWLVRIDIPKRERRFERQTEAMLKAFKEERETMLKAFSIDREEILRKLEAINVALTQNAKTCAVNRSLGMVQYLMDKDSNLTFESASLKVREYWKLNGVSID